MAKKDNPNTEVDETTKEGPAEASDVAPVSATGEPVSEPEADRMGVKREIPEQVTEEGLEVKEGEGVAEDPTKEKLTEKARALKYEEQEELVGDLEPGDTGYLPLDELGNIVGPAQKEKPAPGQPYAFVVSPAESRRPLLMTPAGSPILKRMNPAAESLD